MIPVAIIQLVSTLAPPTIELIMKLIDTFEKSGLTEEEQLKKLNELAGTLKPMTLKS